MQLSSAIDNMVEQEKYVCCLNESYVCNCLKRSHFVNLSHTQLQLGNCLVQSISIFFPRLTIFCRLQCIRKKEKYSIVLPDADEEILLELSCLSAYQVRCDFVVNS